MFTLVLAFSTIGLWAATIGLYFTGEKQIAVASKAADAASKSADAALGAERAWIIVAIDGDNLDEAIESIFQGSDRRGFFVEFHLENVGKTPAFVKDISFTLKLLQRQELPNLVYEPNKPWDDEFVMKAGERVNPVGKPQLSAGTMLDPKAAGDLKTDHLTPWLYGCVVYDDIWGNERTTRFCWKREPYLTWMLPEGRQQEMQRADLASWPVNCGI